MEPVQGARRMFYDNLVYDAAAIHHLLQVFGETQIMVGSDYPFIIMDRDPVERLRSLGLDDDTARALRHGNAMRWLFPARNT
jgi:aminocarboxymuconate-semialdehyde decarboxylase